MPTKFAFMQLSISIVSYNTRDWLRRCLASIFKFTQKLKFEVIVVDNGSTDGSAAMVKREFPQVKLIKNKTNRWYTGANNQALKIARGKYFLILNSDIFLTSNALKTMVDYLIKNPQAGAVEPRQSYPDGRIVPTASRHNRWWWDLCELTLLHRLVKPSAYFRLSGWDRQKTFPAEVISDAAMMVRAKELKKLGGYDESFKLYYTENDLCRRLQRQGWATVHLGRAGVWHRVSASTDKAGWKTISLIYAQDALKYYQKYHSFLSASLLYWLLRLNIFIVKGKALWPPLALVLIAAGLRFYRLPLLMTFIGDQGRDYLAARDMVLTGVWPLTGIPSSVPWLHQGPLFIWATALFLKLGHFHPVTPAFFTAVLGAAAVIWLYRLSKNWWAGLVLATAPLSVIHSRMPYHLSPIPLVACGYLAALKKNSAGWSVFLAALLLQFELSNLPLVFLTVWWFRRQLSLLIKRAPLGLIPFLPKLVYDLSHGFTQTVGLAAWVGYRLVHLGEYGNPAGNIGEFWTKFAAPGWPIAAGLLGGLVLIQAIKAPKFISLTLVFMLIGFLVHGAPSEGYFLVLFPVWAWLLARWRPAAAAVAVLSLVNLFTHQFYTYGPTLADRRLLVEFLPAEFKLVEYSQNPGWASYLDNYRYLLWWRGKNYRSPVGPVYTIYDGPAAEFNQPLETTVYHFPGQKLIKYDH
jgi:hypothetical protein